MDAQYRRGRGRGTGGGGGYVSARGGPGYSRGQGRGRGRGYFRGHGRGGGQGRGTWRGRGRGGGIGPNGRDWGHSSSRGYQVTHRNEKNIYYGIPEEELDPLKVFVGNIRKNIDKEQLYKKLSEHADISSVIIVKKKAKGPNYGFVSLTTEDDVKKIIDLNNRDFYLSGMKLIFRPTRRRYIQPGEEGFVRQALPCRDYDLSPLDHEKPSIHVLVDDVMMKILEYLPLNQRIRCEVVCRRWQSLLYVLFEGTELTIGKDYMDKNGLYVDKASLSKLLLLKGENLKVLSINDGDDDDLKNSMFLMIAQLCPNVETLELSKSTYFDNVNALKDCKKLKSFSAKKNFELDESSFKKLLTILPCLEYIDVSYTDIDGSCFNILPKGLKHLNISWCKEVSLKNFRKVSKVCKSLEVLDMEYLDVDKQFLDDLGSNCTNLKRLALNYFHENDDISEQLKLFTNLTTLRIRACTFELSKIADYVKNLEVLHIQVYNETTSMIDFGKFSQLKILALFSSPFSKQEMMSVEKCKHLENLFIHDCKADQEIIKKIVKGCPELFQIKAREVEADEKFIKDINEIMKRKSEHIKISVNLALCTVPQYDEKKINFEFVDDFITLTSSDDDSDEDSDEELYDSSDYSMGFYDSDDDMFWRSQGYDSDDSESGPVDNLSSLLLGLLKSMKH